MKPIIIVSDKLVKEGFMAITIFPFIILNNKEFKKNKTLIRHETTHIKQQIEMLVVPFYIWYGIEFLIRLLIYKDKNKAYKNISFEREAYDNEKNSSYNKVRRIYNFLRYLK